MFWRILLLLFTWKWYGMIANDTTLHERPNDIEKRQLVPTVRPSTMHKTQTKYSATKTPEWQCNTIKTRQMCVHKMNKKQINKTKINDKHWITGTDIDRICYRDPITTLNIGQWCNSTPYEPTIKISWKTNNSSDG